MSKVADLINEKWIIKNKEHLSKEDYERLAEIETELKEIRKVIQKAFGHKQEEFGKWMPVSERLPDKAGEYIVTDDAGGMATVSTDDLVYNAGGELIWLCSQNVTAWMPLPEPYKESEVKA